MSALFDRRLISLPQITRARRQQTLSSTRSARSARSCRSPPCSHHVPSRRARSCASTTRTPARRKRTTWLTVRIRRTAHPASVDPPGPCACAGRMGADPAQLSRLLALRRRAVSQLAQMCSPGARLPPSLYIDHAPRFAAARARLARLQSPLEVSAHIDRAIRAIRATGLRSRAVTLLTPYATSTRAATARVRART